MNHYDEDAPTREGGIMKREGWNARKSERRNYHYALTKRVLEKFKGRTFNEFFSFIKKRAHGRAGRPFQWIVENYEYVLHMSAEVVDGELLDTRWGVPLRLFGNSFYVMDGVIHKLDNVPRRKPTPRPPKPELGKPFLMKIDGIYYEVMFRRVHSIFAYNWDVVRKAHISKSDAERYYGSAIVPVSKRQLSSKELKDRNLLND